MTNWQMIADFIFEAGMLKRVSREGWKLIGVTQPESVAGHSLRAAQIGYILACLETYDNPEEICSLLVFHDIGEARIGDIHKLASRYITDDESRAVKDQFSKLEEIGSDLYDLWDQMETKKSRGGIIAKDADLLEMAASACEYKNQGYSGAESWLEKIAQQLTTPSAKELFDGLRRRDPDEWWKHLKEITARYKQ
jgi:putative hydrolase of HD superfamily